MRVLLAGSTGEIGRLLVPLLVRSGHTVTGVARHSTGVTSFGSSELEVDIVDREALLAAVDGLEFDAVIHQATALSREPRRYSHMHKTNRLRMEGTSALIAAARATGATRFVSASAFYGYGFENFGQKPVDEDAAFGERPGGPVDNVHRALLSNEQQARAFGGVALRYGLFYRGRGPIPTVASDSAGVLPFVHVEDAAAATVAALDAPAGSVYNVVDDTPATWREVHEARARAFESPDPTVVPSWLMRRTAPYRAELLTATSIRVSNARARAELGWAPSYPSYREGIRSAVTDAAHARAVLASPSRASGAAHGSA
ncbi:NAD-dependent epimerase/dehydratase family protein [Conyzicola sp.]|uniref:NAD-dependent epimerase/dehydratase family protein n=1 Tax=Conyzicola sp. TaxID=1969404 RepID=UPI0039896BE8